MIDPIARLCAESEILREQLTLDGARILELGCGKAEATRRIAADGQGRTIVACEVDEIQHAMNLARTDLPNVTFRLGGAEAIAAADESFDVVMLFKSLHHVPMPLMAQALKEIRRVLRPGGVAYVSEPIFAGDFNEILRLFHNEERVRAAAFSALEAAVKAGEFELVAEVFFRMPVRYADFGEFEREVIGVTHTRHRLSAEVRAEVERRFAGYVTEDGAGFENPMRVDVLRRPVSE